MRKTQAHIETVQVFIAISPPKLASNTILMMAQQNTTQQCVRCRKDMDASIGCEPQLARLNIVIPTLNVHSRWLGFDTFPMGPDHAAMDQRHCYCWI